MAKMKQYTFREMESIVRRNGYVYVRANGTHCVYKKDGVEKTIVLSKHRDVNACIARRLIKENNLIVK
jgi:predicted RNA binding protein YcfA (HicA-like mRNA interferase family)